MEKKTLQLTCKEYLTIQALFHVVDDPVNRLALSFVWYDAEKDLFVATDGHIMRQEQIAWSDGKKPEESFLLDQNDMLLTKAQLKNKFGSHFENCGITVQYETKRYNPRELEGKNEIVYPKIWNVVPDLDKKAPIEQIGITPANFDPFMKSFYVKPKVFTFQFTGELTPILIFSNEENKPKRFVGIWMPVRILATGK